ncbi:hypothetical protein Brsp06_03739 [Brucella sp. NBRC 13694]
MTGMVEYEPLKCPAPVLVKRRYSEWNKHFPHWNKAATNYFGSS